MSGEKILQNWDIKVIKDDPVFPFILIDNWYTPNEEKAVWKSTHKNFTEFKSIWKDFEKTINPENTTHNLLGVL